MKKIIAFITSAALCGLYLTAVHASGGWSTYYEEPAVSSKPIDRETEYMEIIETDGSDHYSAAASNVFHARFARSKQNNTYLYAENSLKSPLDESKTYDFSFYMKGEFDTKGLYVGIGTNENLTSGGMVCLLRTTRYTTQDAANGWKLYSFENIAYNGSGSHFRIKIVQLCDDIYIDDVVLTEHGESENLIIDGSFENTESDDPGDIGNQQIYAPTNFIATQRAGHIMLSWKNPAAAGLNRVSVYDVTGAEETELTNTVSAAPGSYIAYDVTGLEEGSEHIFKVVFDYGSITSTEMIISATASEKRPQSLMSVYYTGNHPGIAYIERSDTHSPGGALRMISNKQSWEGNNYFNAQTDSISFSESNEYEVSVWIKGTYAGSTNINYLDLIKASWTKFKSAEVVEETEDGWKNVVYKTSGIGSNPLMILAESRTDILIDDIEVWRMSDGERFSLVFSRDFNSEDAAVAAIDDLSVETGSSRVKINWSAPEAADRVRVYVSNGEELSLRAEVAAGYGAVEFDRLKNDYGYTYIVKAVDKFNNESEGVEITAVPSPEDYECIEYGLYKNDAPLDTFEGDGTYTVKAVMKNNKIEEGIDSQVIAVLRKDGERVDAVASEIKHISKTPYDAAGTQLQTTVNIPDISDGEYEISVYLWDSIGSMTILAPYKTYKEAIE